MAIPERRITPRFKFPTPISIHRTEASNENEVRSKAINISREGLYFVARVKLSVGETVEVLVKMPKRVTGVETGTRRFVGRVRHIEMEGIPEGQSGIGVQLLYYER